MVATDLHANNHLSLQDAVDAAVAGNPALAAIISRAAALAELPPQVGALPDPSLSVHVLNMPLDTVTFTREAMTQFQIGISQALPFPGKRALRSEVATHQAVAADADAEEFQQILVHDVRMLWWSVFYFDRALEVIERNRLLLLDMVRVAESRYRVGSGRQQDVLLAQLEFSRLREKVIRLQNMRDNEAARLNVLMGRATTSVIRLPPSVEESLPALGDLESLLRLAVGSRPRLEAQRYRVEAARSRTELAKKDRSPDFNVGAAYAFRGGEEPGGGARADFLSLTFSVSLPVYAGRKQDRALDQRSAEWLDQRYRLQDEQNKVLSEVTRARTDYEKAGAELRLLAEDVLPQARQTMEVMIAGYTVGTTDFFNMIRSQTILFDHEIQYWKVLSNANQALARVIAAVGSEEGVYD